MILYHYTTLEKFKSIIENSKNKEFVLRGTQFEYLNDYSEIKRGINLLYRNLETYEQKLNRKYGKEMIKKLRDNNFFENFINKTWFLDDKNSQRIFITSFSEEENSLPMWNMYANEGTGIAIGISKKIITKKLISEKCLYDDETLDDKLLKEIFENITPHINGMLNSVYFIKIFAKMKHSAFHYEKEHRLIRVKDISKNTKDIMFQDSNGLLKPYIENKIPIDAIAEIRIGPCADKKLQKQAIIHLLANSGISLPENKIIESDIPYRHI